MYKLNPYDLTDKFHLIPNKEKYCMTFCHGNTVKFRSKREAFDFISKISNFFIEVLQFSEMIQLSINSYRYHITPTSKSPKDLYNIYTENEGLINKLIGELKHFRTTEKEVYKLEMKYNNLLSLLYENVKILYKKLPKAIAHILILIKKLSTSFSLIISNAEQFYKNNSLSIFIK